MLLYQNTPVYGKRFKVFILWGLGVLANLLIPLIVLCPRVGASSLANVALVP